VRANSSRERLYIERLHGTVGEQYSDRY